MTPLAETDGNDAVKGSTVANEEKIASIQRLISEGKRDFYAENYGIAAEKLGEALEISNTIYESHAPENFDAYLWYGRAMLEQCRMDGEVLDQAVADLPESDDGDSEEQDKDEKSSENEETNQDEANDKTVTDKDDAEEGNDGDEEEETSDIQLAWEILEVARTICEKATKSKEWELKKAEVLFHLSDVSLINDDFDKAIEDLNVAIEIQKKHLNANDRIIAQTYLQLARSYKSKDDYASAATYYKLSKDTILNKIAELNAAENANENERNSIQTEIDELQSIANDLSLKVEDAEESFKQIENKLNSVREKIGLARKLQESTSAPANDITNMIRKPVKRPAADETDGNNKKSKEDEASTDVSTTI